LPVTSNLMTLSVRSARRISLRSLVWLGSLAWAMGAVSLPAVAALGESATSVEADRESMNANVTLNRFADYTVQELQAPTGILVKEYVSSQGLVFAVSWQGPVMPDLRQLLGHYFDRLAEAADKRGGHRQLTIRDTDLVVQSSGRMRSFNGRAYLPQLVPSGVAVEKIQ